MNRIDNAAHTLMDYKGGRVHIEGEYAAAYHEGRLYSVRNLTSGIVSLVFATSPANAIKRVRRTPRANNEADPAEEETTNTSEPKSLNEICTDLRVYAAECGGEHHTPKEIEAKLRTLADELQQIAYDIKAAGLGYAKVNEAMTGITNEHYRLHMAAESFKKLNPEDEVIARVSARTKEATP